MDHKIIYLNYLKKNGIPLSEINIGSNEIALDVIDALKALDIFRNTNIIILGGDILSEEDNQLIYAYQYWGDKYQFLNWYCEVNQNECIEEYQNRSIDLANKNILIASKIAKKLKKKCFIVFVIK